MKGGAAVEPHRVYHHVERVCGTTAAADWLQAGDPRQRSTSSPNRGIGWSSTFVHGRHSNGHIPEFMQCNVRETTEQKLGKDRRGGGAIKALWRLVDEFMHGRKVLIPVVVPYGYS